jgi:hypothetical protein
MTIAEPVPNIDIHQTIFNVEGDINYAIQLIEMKDSFFIWVGQGPVEESADPTGILGQLALAMPNRFV